MTADVGTLQRLPKLIPIGIVKELAYTGRNFGAAEAQQLGFVNQVFDPRIIARRSDENSAADCNEFAVSSFRH